MGDDACRLRVARRRAAPPPSEPGAFGSVSSTIGSIEAAPTGGADGRRRWSRYDKGRIIEETSARHAKLSEVARRHDIRRSNITLDSSQPGCALAGVREPDHKETKGRHMAAVRSAGLPAAQRLEVDIA
uniref:transposase n=1 Tax=uncultured Caulobacter sp. TaxID=158749 RepID=UPI00345C29F9